uniref:Uncharacterized protein n=1 Tax=viral metagenome TaxID=1070528 RepID=A0A6C0KNV0_9ZZZZ
MNTGFSKSLLPNPKKSKQNIKKTASQEKSLCKEIFKIDKTINNKYSFPSQFPILTGIKKTQKKGGKKKGKTLRNRKL